MPVNHEGEESVYTRQPVEERETGYLYRAVRELVNRSGPNQVVLDLGCSDLVASRILGEQGHSVIGVDLSIPSLKKARTNAPQISVIAADITGNFPIDPSKRIDTVLLLDVLEHFNKSQAIELLRQVKNFESQPRIIVTMPIISPFTLPTLIEAYKWKQERKRPLTGLFDRTHEILTDRNGHLALFKAAGYCVKQEYYTNWMNGISGTWTTVEIPKNSNVKPDKEDKAIEYMKLLGYRMIPKAIHPFDVNKRQLMRSKIMAYQGMYVLAQHIY